MRKILFLFLTLSALCFQSCLKEDENLFDKSASERMSSTLEAYKSTLVASEFGWAMEYYPEENQSYGGYVYTIKFTEDDATIALDLAGSATTKTGLYKLVADDGPVLTFDTYNLFMHFFAKPSQSSPDGYRGDYEFIFMGYENNVISLKGKKTGNKMTLTKLTESYVTFIDKINLSRSKINGAPKIGMRVGGEAVLAVKTSAQLAFTYMDGSKNTEVSVAYIPTTNGIKLYDPITIKGEKFQNFTYTSDGLGMICSTNDKVVISFIYPPFNEMMALTPATWKFQVNGGNMSSGLSSLLAGAIKTNTVEYDEAVTMFYMGLNSLYPTNDKVNKFAFVFKSAGYNISYGYRMTPVEGTEDQVKIVLTNEGFNWKFYKWFLPPIMYIADHSPYKMETDDKKNPSYVKYVSVADPNIWFRVDK